MMIKMVRSLTQNILRMSINSFCVKKPQEKPEQKTQQKAEQKTEQKPEQKPEQKSNQITFHFTDRLLIEKKQQVVTNGRSWRAEQLRLKSTDDLHKLWYVCVRQKNLVLADELAREHDPSYIRKAGKIRKVQKLDQTMSRILHVIHQREHIKKQYRKKLEDEYIQKKRAELEAVVSLQPQVPEITREMLKEKYEALRKGKDNVQYLEKIWKRNQESQQRHQRAEDRVQKLDPAKQFSSFWEYQMTIGERPTQNEILKTHIKNWKSLNLKQRKIILGFLNARRSKDAKSTFVRQLKILGQKIAFQQMKTRSQNSSSI